MATGGNMHKMFVAGDWEDSAEPQEILSPYDGSVVGVTYRTSEEQAERATQAAVQAFQATRKLQGYERARILRRILDGLEKNLEDIARTIVLEGGKPWKDAFGEAQRALHTVETAMEEAKRLPGEVMPLDLRESARGRMGILRRYPLGPVAAISPFNFPLNLPLHKMAPALAAGNTFVLKPASKTPLTMLKVARLVQEADVPRGTVSILPMVSALAEKKLAQDDRYKLLTFTGSAAIGWRLKALAGKKRVTLELGGNAGVIVDQSADLSFAAQQIARGGFSYAGQSCISVQRIYVHDAVLGEFSQDLVERVKRLKVGDPMDPETDVGPMIEPQAAQRTEEWVQEAVAEGATVLVGGKANGSFFQPTVLTNVKATSKVCSMEVFAPLVNIIPFSDFKEAVAEVNNSIYGLQAGVFTQNLEHAFYAFDELEVGGVIVNDVSAFRTDPMPYGGVKDSGMGREGPRFALEEMTELRLMVLNRS